MNNLNDIITILPSTGGVGRTIFIVVASVILAVAVILVIIRKKIQKQ